jgi:hypothetical protein
MMLICLLAGCKQYSSSPYGRVSATDEAVSNNLACILHDLQGGNGEDGHFPARFSELLEIDAVLREQSHGASSLDLNSNYFVCPGTGTKPGNITNVDDWTDFISIGNSKDFDPAVPVVISPPENHKGKFGYVVTPGQGIFQLPADKVRALVKEPWLLCKDGRGRDVESVKRDIVVNVPPRLRPYYTNVNNWTRPPSKW